MKIFIKENINDIEISKSKWLSHFHEAYDFKLGFRTYRDGKELSIEQTEAIRQENSSVRMEIN